MKTLLIIDHKSQTCRIYINCATKNQAKKAGFKVKGEMYKFNNEDEALKEAKQYGYTINYTTL